MQASRRSCAICRRCRGERIASAPTHEVFEIEATEIEAGDRAPAAGVQNLADTVNNAQVTRLTPAAGAVAIGFNLSVASVVQLEALVRHNLVGAETVRFRLYSAANQGGSLLDDSGVISVWPGGGAAVAGLGQTRPYAAAAPQTALSGRIDFASLGGVLEIGALELAQWWPVYISPGAQIGFSTRAKDQSVIGGGAEAGDSFTPRTMSGQCDYLALTTTATTGLDFQGAVSKTKPFVWVQDYDDPTTWGRGCYPARNSDLPSIVGALYRHDRFQLRLVEHYR